MLTTFERMIAFRYLRARREEGLISVIALFSLIGIALGLLFAGGALGKFICGWLGERIGVRNAVLLTECGTALAALQPDLVARGHSVSIVDINSGLQGIVFNGMRGTTPAVESVMRRFESAMPSPSSKPSSVPIRKFPATSFIC